MRSGMSTGICPLCTAARRDIESVREYQQGAVYGCSGVFVVRPEWKYWKGESPVCRCSAFGTRRPGTGTALGETRLAKRLLAYSRE